MEKGHVTTEMNAGRILAHGQITELPFTLGTGVPFSIFLVPKEDVDFTSVVIPAKLYQDDEASPCPFNIDQWTETAVIELQDNGGLLDDYDVYYGTGQALS